MPELLLLPEPPPNDEKAEEPLLYPDEPVELEELAWMGLETDGGKLFFLEMDGILKSLDVELEVVDEDAEALFEVLEALPPRRFEYGE